jgi:6-phosphogluconolactonase
MEIAWVGRRTVLGALGVGMAEALLLTGCAGARRPAGPEPSAAPAPAQRPLFVGTYTDGDDAGTGVTIGTWDVASGRLAARTVVPVANPSFLALDPGGRALYAVDEQEDGAVTALALVDGGGLRAINTESSKGAGPAHLCVHPSGRYVLAANYDSGSVVVLPVRPDGGLGPVTDLAQHSGSGPDPDRQGGPHPHQVVPDPRGDYLHVVDLGTDSVYAYQLDLRGGVLAVRHQVRLPPGTGPRHLAFHPSGRFAYLAAELAGTVISFQYAGGVLTPAQRQPSAPNPPPGVRNQPAEIVVSPDGRFVHVSNRGPDSISTFAVAADGLLLARGAQPCGGHTPRHIALDATGGHLFSANQDSNTVTSFAVNRGDGSLTPRGAALSTPQPVCILAL